MIKVNIESVSFLFPLKDTHIENMLCTSNKHGGYDTLLFLDQFRVICRRGLGCTRRRNNRFGNLSGMGKETFSIL